LLCARFWQVRFVDAHPALTAAASLALLAAALGPSLLAVLAVGTAPWARRPGHGLLRTRGGTVVELS